MVAVGSDGALFTSLNGSLQFEPRRSFIRRKLRNGKYTDAILNLLSTTIFDSLTQISIVRQVPLTKDDWVSVLSWAMPILLVDEILKAVGRWIHREERRPAAGTYP